jgi:hypothetical protein
MLICGKKLAIIPILAVALLWQVDTHGQNHAPHHIASMSEVISDNIPGYVDDHVNTVTTTVNGVPNGFWVYVKTLKPMTFLASGVFDDLQIAEDVRTGGHPLLIPAGSICFFNFYGNANANPSLMREYHREVLVGDKYYRQFDCAHPLPPDCACNPIPSSFPLKGWMVHDQFKAGLAFTSPNIYK